MFSRKMRMLGSLKARAIILVISLFALPYGLLSFMFIRKLSLQSLSQLEESKFNTVIQIGMNLDNVAQSMSQTSLRLFQYEPIIKYLESDDSAEMESYKKLMIDFLMNLIAYQRAIEGISISRLDGTQYVMYSTLSRIDPERCEEILKQNGKIHFMEESSDSRYFIFSRKLTDIVSLEHVNGVVQLYVGEDTILSLFDQLNSDYVLYDKCSNKVITQRGEGFDLDYSSLSSSDMGIIRENGSVLAYYALSDSIPWVFVADLEINKTYGFLLQGIVFILVGIVSSVLIFWWLYHKIFIRLDTICDAMDRNSEDVLTTIPEDGDDEIAKLSHSFNQMNMRLNEQIEKVYKAELGERNAVIKQLRAYINPHFFFNTLDTICWIARQENADETCVLVEALSHVFQESISTDRQIVSVKEEVDVLKEYIKIQECRFSESIEFVINQEEGTDEYQTVSSVLQPLVENAIEHGINPTGEEGTIVIDVHKENDTLVFSVSDNGVTPDVERINALIRDYTEGKKGMALYGVNSRIRLHWGEKYGLLVKENLPRGMSAVITQPLERV